MYFTRSKTAISPAYLKWREETLQKGRQEGRQEERQQIVENVLKARFGSLDEELSEAIAPMLQLPSEELTRLLLTLSREELLARFGYGAWREAILQEGRIEERRQIVENVLRLRFGCLVDILSR